MFTGVEKPTRPGQFARVFAFFDELRNPSLLLGNPVAWVLIPFQLWMLIDSVRREEWIWAVFIFIAMAYSSVLPISALLYYFMVYRTQGPVGGGGGLTRGFELPGASERRRIRELQGRIHHLDKARDHLELADILFSQGKLQQAETSYRASLERDPSDLDAVAHLGQCLLRMGRAAEALPLLERVTAEDSRHDYGHSLMALAETQSALGRANDAFESWRRVLECHGYARARVQFAELLLARGDRERARGELNEVISDDLHAPKFQRGRDKPWVQRARTLLQKL